MRCERAIKALAPHIHAHDLGRTQISVLAPLMLGFTAWEAVRDSAFGDWSSFKRIVEEKFGLTRQQLEDAFFAMTMDPSETADDFILRVEEKRIRH
jgi:hypothetical protein